MHHAVLVTWPYLHGQHEKLIDWPSRTGLIFWCGSISTKPSVRYWFPLCRCLCTLTERYVPSVPLKPQHPPWSPEHLLVCVCVSVARIWVWCVVFEQTLDRCLGLFADSYKTPEYSAWLGIPLLAILGDLSAQASSPIFERIFNHFIHCRLNFAFHIPFPHPIVYVMLRPKECDNYKPCPHWSTRNKTKFLNHLGFLLLLRASSRIWGHIWIGF